jgi:hypothetical protein
MKGKAMSKAHMPPVPPASRSPHAGASNKPKPGEEQVSRNARERDTAEQGRQGNVNQNTHNQGYQQDR